MAKNYTPRKQIRKQKSIQKREQLTKRGLTSVVLASVFSNFVLSTVRMKADEKDGSNTILADANQIKTGNSFIDEIAPVAADLAQQHDLYASVMIAQALIESANGTSALARIPYYNLFGIKGNYQGQSVSMPTQEQESSGQYITITADFRSYPSYQESLEDYAALLSTNLYANARKSSAPTYQDATKALTGLYATSLTYNDTLNAVIDLYDLTRFDTATASLVKVNVVKKIYTTQAGDNLSKIAENYHTTVEELMSMNQLSSDLLQVEQPLIVREFERPVITEAEEAATIDTLYTVQSGDTLSEIAASHDISLDDLIAWNGLTSNLIYRGNQLIIKRADPVQKNALAIRKAQLQLEKDLNGEVFGLPNLSDFSYQLTGDANQYQVDFKSLDTIKISQQKKTFDTAAAALASIISPSISGKAIQLNNDQAATYSATKKAKSLIFTNNDWTVSLKGNTSDDIQKYANETLLPNLLALQEKLPIDTRVEFSINLSNSVKPTFTLTWQEGKKVYQTTAASLELLTESITY
ncbi:MAG: LysM peptidoglycan-binding domain-containing protein [Streptococcaceae bacterium]|nr:LysM peptidoglycan-binding domain-containing protein [Streptococcaceae bacterium]